MIIMIILLYDNDELDDDEHNDLDEHDGYDHLQCHDEDDD